METTATNAATTTASTEPHPLRAVYLGQSPGEDATFALRARLARETAAARSASPTPDRDAAVLLAGLGLAATAAVAHLVGRLTRGR